MPFAASIKDVDGVFSGLGGSNPLKFLKTYQELGLKDKVPLTGGWTLMDDTLLKAMGDEAVQKLKDAAAATSTKVFVLVPPKPPKASKE